KMLVTEGDIVTDGQVIAELDTREEDAKLMELTGELKSAEFQIEAANADLNLKTVTLERKRAYHAEAIAQNPKFSNSEIDEARAAMEVAVIAKAFREHELGQKKQE